jgi:hypothetical protein
MDLETVRILVSYVFAIVGIGLAAYGLTLHRRASKLLKYSSVKQLIALELKFRQYFWQLWDTMLTISFISESDNIWPATNSTIKR